MKLIMNWLIAAFAVMLVCTACNSNNSKTDGKETVADSSSNFKVEAESFADLQLLRYQVPGFNALTLQQKQLAYYLSEAALCGRDIIYDQKSKYGIMLRKTLEKI